MKLIFDPICSWSLLVPAVAALLTMVLVTYPRRVRHLPTFTRRLLIGLRLAAAVILALAMLRPAIQYRQTDQKRPRMLIMIDTSRSMNTQDGPGGLTRHEALLKTLADNRKFFDELDEDVEIVFYDFDEEIIPVDEPGEEAEGQQTAIGSALNELLRESQQGRVLSVVLMSDGAERTVGAGSVDPRAVARRFAQMRIPIYAVPYGGTGISDTSLDVIVEDLIVDPLVFEKTVVAVSAKIRVLGAAGRPLTVRLLVEDRSGKRRGESGELKAPPTAGNTRNVQPAVTVTPSENQEVMGIELSWVPTVSGEFKIAVAVDPVDGELRQGNNRRETVIIVQAGGINVAYFDRLRWEQKFIGAVNTAEKKIQIDMFIVRGGKFKHLNVIDPDVFDPKKYDAYIIGDVPADVFGMDRLRKMAARIYEGTGFLMLGGFQSFGPGGYAGTPLEALLPVAMSPAEKHQGGVYDTTLHHQRDLRMLPTALGLNRYIMRLDSAEKNLERWRSLAPLNRGNRLRPKNEFVEILAETPDGIPMLIVTEDRSARIAAFAGDSTWLWHMQGRHDEHQRFWRQMILWLSRKEKDGDEKVWADVDPRNFSPNQPVEIMFGARTDDGKPIPDADFTVTVHDPDNQVKKSVPRRSGNENSTVFRETKTPGDYWVKVEARKSGQSLEPAAWTRFIVDARDLELDNPAADLDLLAEITRLTGGDIIAPEHMGKFLSERVKEGILSSDLTRLESLRLWDNWPFLLLFVLLMSAEWFVRKRKGLV